MGQRAHNLSSLIGLKFGRLEVLERAKNNKQQSAMWLCKCDCGGTKTTTTTNLRKGLTSSCGCLRKETAALTARTRKQREKTDWTNRATKWCPRCKKELPIQEFGKNRAAYDGVTKYCKFHHYQKGMDNLTKNWGSAKQYRLKYRHGITLEQYEAMLTAQDHKCAICLRYPEDNLKNPWHVDHDHSTGKVRGILCHSCNTALGNFKDDVHLLMRAVEYLTVSGQELV